MRCWPLAGAMIAGRASGIPEAGKARVVFVSFQLGLVLLSVPSAFFAKGASLLPLSGFWAKRFRDSTGWQGG